MKKAHKIILLLIGIVVILVVFIFSILGKKGVGQIIDKLGITSDEYVIDIDKQKSSDIYIYWHGETVNGINDNRMLFYHRSKVSEIPSLYGYNGFEIKYKNTSYDKIRFWKIFPYAKYKYYINIKSLNDNMIIEWRISNWYDNDVHQGVDTIPSHRDN
jgi:hypothetical protein